jgi:hypothetical protein
MQNLLLFEQKPSHLHLANLLCKDLYLATTHMVPRMVNTAAKPQKRSLTSYWIPTNYLNSHLMLVPGQHAGQLVGKLNT